MKYILLDTNIIIDMVVDRKNQMSSDLLESFIKLLDYDEIKLIVPEIVEFETYKHLQSELEQVGKNIQEVMDKIKELYGVTAYKIDGLNIEEYKKESRKQLNQALNMFLGQKEDYKNELFNTIKMVFEHRNSIRIADDGFLNTLVMKRRIYKKAPFHKEKKESYADGLITETLINLKKYIELKKSDKIYFVTGNFKDFCDMINDKNRLHPHIIEDLKKQDLETQVIYVNKFNLLIKKELSDNVKNAKLSEEFERELKEQQEEEEAAWEIDYKDMIRESAGLSSLGEFESKLQDGLIDSCFQQDVINLFEQINKCYQKLEELEWFYEDEIENYIQQCDISEGEKIIEIFEKMYEKYGGPNLVERKILNFGLILEWIEEQKYDLREIMSADYLPDNINFGDHLKIFDCNHKEFFFDLEELYLSPEDGSSDIIDIKITDKKGKIQAQGDIEVIYGFINYDEDGGAADGCEEEITYCYEQITEFLKKICSDWEAFIEKQNAMIEYLENRLAL
jgi:predicted nucleic acid-binding protein